MQLPLQTVIGGVSSIGTDVLKFGIETSVSTPSGPKAPSPFTRATRKRLEAPHRSARAGNESLHRLPGRAGTGVVTIGAADASAEQRRRGRDRRAQPFAWQ